MATRVSRVAVNILVQETTQPNRRLSRVGMNVLVRETLLPSVRVSRIAVNVLSSTPHPRGHKMWKHML